MKTIKELVRFVYKTYSFIMDKIFNFVLGPETNNYSYSFSASGKYILTSGGSVIHIDE